MAKAKARRPDAEPSTPVVEGILTPVDSSYDRPPKVRALFVAGVEAFAELGYHATTTREIASRVGLSPAGLYIHFASKEELLFEICRFGHGRVAQLMADAAEIDDPTERIARMARESAVFHAEHHTLARVNQNEFRALSVDHRREVFRLRREITDLHRTAMRDGIRDGVFRVEDLVGTSVAVLTLCHDVARWFPTREINDPQRVGELYAELALRMVGADTAS